MLPWQAAAALVCCDDRDAGVFRAGRGVPSVAASRAGSERAEALAGQERPRFRHEQPVYRDEQPLYRDEQPR